MNKKKEFFESSDIFFLLDFFLIKIMKNLSSLTIPNEINSSLMNKIMLELRYENGISNFKKKNQFL